MLSNKELKLLDKIKKKSVYEDKFFEKRSELKWFYELKERGYFNPNPDTSPRESREKGFYYIPQWNVLPYLEKVSQQVSVPENEKFIDELLEIIKKVTTYHIQNNKILDNYHTWYYFVKILLNIPNDRIPFEIIELIPIWLDSKFDTTLQGSEIATNLLPKFLTDDPEDIKKAERIIDIITTIKIVQVSKESEEIFGIKKEARLIIDPYWLEEAFEKYSKDIGEKCSITVIEDIVKKIKQLLTYKEKGTNRTFYEESKILMYQPLEILTFILKRILIAKANVDIKTTREILRKFLDVEYLYFPKMALYVIGQNVDDYIDVFWEMLKTDSGELIMVNTIYLGDELRHLLKNLTNLTDEQRKLLAKKIEEAAKKRDSKEEKDIVLFKQRIYEALSHDKFFKDLYDEMKKITGVDVKLQPLIGKIETQYVQESPPLTKKDIIEMPNDKLAEYLATFKTKDSWEGPTIDGLASLLFEVAKETPDKFIKNFSPFKDTGFIYVYEILRGIKEAWNAKRGFNWSKLLHFIEDYIDRKEFWEDKFIVEEDDWIADHKRIVGEVAELIQEGTRDDSWAFPEEYFDKAEKIIFSFLDKLEPEAAEEKTDYVTYTLNTPPGKTITALLFLALRIARINEQKGIVNEKKWRDEYKEKYEYLLNKKFIEGFANLGRYLPSFYYLDKEWVKERIKYLENEKGSEYWEAFMDGYLFNGRVYDELYSFMRSHYQYGIEHNFKEERNNEHLVQHIALFYLKGQESITEKASLFKNILDRFNYDQIREIINFFWMQRSYISNQIDTDKNIRKRIIEFWKWLYEKYKDKDPLEAEDKKILSAVAKLSVFLPQIDEESFTWLMLSAPYIHEDFNCPFFIEYLNNLKDKGDHEITAEYIGKIFIKMLESYTPYYDKKHIHSIVEFLYKSNAEDYANKICNIYGSRGYEFLRDLWEKYNKSDS